MTLPYNYYPLVLAAIDWISQGETKTAACDKVSISVGTFENYIRNDEQLQELYTEADIRGSDALADALVKIDTHKLYGRTDPKMAKVISDNIKWLLEKRKSKQYGQKVQVEHNITMDKAIIQGMAAGRLRASQRNVIEDAQYVELPPLDEDTELALMLQY